MEVIFLRHAKTDLNGKGYIATKKDYFLNEIGREECLRNVFQPNSFNRVYCSSYKRTVETVKIVYPLKQNECYLLCCHYQTIGTILWMVFVQLAKKVEMV